MDILDDSGAISSPVSLDDLVQTSPLPADPPPVAATRNQAAITSLISNPFKVQDTYNTIMTESQQGSSATQDMLKQQAKSAAKEQDMGSLMSMLSDTSVPHSQKQSAVENFNINKNMQDTSTILHNNLLAQPAKQETPDAEVARISTVDALNEMANSRSAIQVMANSLKDAENADDASTQFWNHAAGLIPFRSAIIQDKVYRQVQAETGVPRSVWETMDSYLRTGTETKKMIDYVNGLPPQQQEAVARSMYNSVKNRTGFLYGNDNHHEAFEQFSKVFSTGAYGRGSEFLDNFASVLDLATASSTLKDLGLMGKNVARMVNGKTGFLNQSEADAFARANAGKPIQSTNRIEPTMGDNAAATADANPIPANLGTVPNPGTPMVANPAVKSLQDEKSNLLGIAGNTAEKGGASIDANLAEAQARDVGDLKTLTKQNQDKGMKFKEAQDAAQKQIDSAQADKDATVSNLQSQKQTQLSAEKARIRIQDIDNQIAGMPSHVPAQKKVLSESIGDMMTRLSSQQAVHQINPNSPMEIAHNANPDTARSLHQAIVTGDDEMAQALSGADKEQAIVNNTMPQASHTGTVFTRTADIDRTLREADQVDPSLVNLIDQTSANAMTPMEAASARARVVNDFENANGLVHNDAMSSFSWDGSRATIKQVYEVAGGSFSDAEQAIEQAKYALRQYGIEDKDITLLRKNGINHEPVELDAVRGQEGDYKIQVNANPELGPSFMNEISNLDVKRNPLDRFAGTHFKDRGSIQRYVVDAASMLHQTLTGASVVAKDYGARFERILMGKAEDFAKTVKGFSKDRQAKIDDYFREANFKGIAFDKTDLAARGFTDSEVAAIRKWRSFWDDHHYLENLDVVRSLRNQGYEYFKNKNAELFARPIGRSTNVTSFYDPAIDAVRSFNKGELDDLYNKGGTIARLRRPSVFNGDATEHMIVRQTPSEYTRALKDSDKVLNKREGYFTVTYKAAKFVDEVDSTGKKVRTLAVAGDTKEAQAFINRTQANNPGKLYNIRNDDRGFRYNSDEHWDINEAGGRIAQRHRGQLLEDAAGLNHLGDHGYVESPALSAERAAKSISGRTVMRNVIDTGVERFMKQYEEVLPKNAWGEARFPQSAAEIGKIGERNTKLSADARTTWEYLNWLRQGYINSMNDGYKAVLNTMADAAGEKSAFLERGLRKAGDADVANFPRKTVFAAYLATSPLRQVFTQAVQAWRIASYNPTGLLSGRVPKLIMEFYVHHTGLTSATTDFTKFIDKSGLAEAVKHHNLAGSVLESLADEGNAITRGVKSTIGFSRRIGFDNGELANMISHAAAVYDRYKALGRDLKNTDVAQRAHDEIRALTYDMNAAGDMPYNQGAAATFLQFMQMPHKAWLQMTNRRLEPTTRARMLVGDLLLWGGALDFVSDKLGFDFLPQNDTEAQKIMHEGLVSYAYNHTLQKFFPNTHDVDFGMLNPYGIDGWTKLFTAASTGGLMPILNSSPAGSFFSGRFAKVFKQMSSVFAPQPYDNRNTPEKFVDIMTSVADLSSGFSNAHKAYLMMKAGEQRDKYGALIDEKTTTGDAIAQSFGFQSKEEAQSYALGVQMSTDSKSHKDEALKVYKNIKQFYADAYAGTDTPDMDRLSQIAGAAMQMYENDPVALQVIQQQFARDAAGTDNELAKQMLRSFGLPGNQDFKTRIERGPWDDGTKAQMKQALDYMQNAQASLDQQTEGNK
jgi:hypothetical protein